VSIFSREQAWNGGTYGLAIVVRPPDADAMQRLLSLFWNSQNVSGCYVRRDQEPADQQRVEPLLEPPDLYGVATINGVEIVCSSTVVRMPDEDWLYLTVPMGAIHDAFKVDVTAPTEQPSWEPILLPWFIDQARALAAAASFHVAFIGWFGDNAEDDELDQFDQLGSVPSERALGYFVPKQAEPWFPATNRS
jgi:hypothetical protein